MAAESFEPFKDLPRDEKFAEKIRSEMRTDYSEALKAVEKLAAEVDAEYAFECLVTSSLSQIAGGYEELEHGSFPALVELAAFYLVPRFGLGGDRDAGRIQAIIDALRKLHTLRIFVSGLDIDYEDKELAFIRSWLVMRAESVRGTAYPPHLRARIEGIQTPFDQWFEKAVGISPSRALQVLDAYEGAAKQNFLKTKERLREVMDEVAKLAERFGEGIIAPTDPRIVREKDAVRQRMEQFMEKMPTSLAPSRNQLAERMSNFKQAEWDGLRELIGLTPETRKKIEKPRDVQNRPVYYLSGDRFLFFDRASVYDALFEAFDQLTRADQKFRDTKYIPHLAKWVETEVSKYVRRIFPAENVFASVTYPDPDKKGGEAELDAAVFWPPFLLLGEVKGKQFRPRSRTGDPARLRDDLRANIEDAFTQATRATRFIESADVVKFKEKATGRILEIRRHDLQRIFPISITLHHFAGLTTQLAWLKNIGLFKDWAYPWSVSLGDLDIITRFAETPDVFLHYIQRRFDLQRSEKNIMGDELDLFGTYLDSRLHPSQFWDSTTEDGKHPTLFMISGGSERFDEWHEAELGRREKHPDIKLDFPPRLTEVLRELRLRKDDASRWIAFALLDLSPGAVSQLEKDLAEVRRHAEPGTRLPRATLKDGDVAVSIIASNGLSAEELHRQAVLRINLEKYRLRTSASLLIAIDVLKQKQPFEFALWAEGPWKHEEILEKLLADDKPTAIISDHVPGRNEPCPCGSGKKFKKCCLGKLQLERRSR
jgi:SEC-C motif